MGKTHRSAQGKMVDMEQLRLQNELVPAIGNMKVNARGDQLGPGGKVVKTREQLLDEHYKKTIGQKKPKIQADNAGSSVDKSHLQDDIPTSSGRVNTVEATRSPEPETTETVEKEPETKNLKGGLAQALSKTKED